MIPSRPDQPFRQSVTTPFLQLVRNQDYSINYQTGEIRLLNNTIPMTTNGSLLDVNYDPASASQASGHSAMSATVTYSKGKVNAMARYHNADEGFAPLDPGSALSVQRSTEWSASYAPTPALTLSTAGNNTLSPVNQMLGAFSGTAQMLQQTRAYTLDYHQTNLPSVMLQHSSSHSLQSSDARLGDSSTSDNLSVSWVKGPLTATANLNRTSGQTSQSAFVAGGDQQSASTISRMQNTTNNASLNLGYHPNNRIDVGVNISGNTLQSSTDGTPATSGGNSMQANATYHPKDNLTFTASMQNNSTDPVKSTTGIISPAQKNRNLSLNANWQPKKNVTVGMNYSADHNDGGTYGTTATSTLSANVGWQANAKTTINGYVARQLAQSPEIGSPSSSTLVGINAQTSLKKNTTVSLGVQHISGQNGAAVNQLWQTQAQTMAASSTATPSVGMPSLNSTSLTALSSSFTYHLGEKQDLALTAAALQGDPGNVRQTALGIGWHYHVDDRLSFTLDALKVKYLDDTDAAPNNSSLQLNAGLTWHF